MYSINVVKPPPYESILVIDSTGTFYIAYMTDKGIIQTNTMYGYASIIVLDAVWWQHLPFEYTDKL